MSNYKHVIKFRVLRDPRAGEHELDGGGWERSVPEGETGMLGSQNDLCELEEQGGKEKDAREWQF